MYLITGASGNVGKELVEQLLAAGEAVRVLTRDAAKVQGWGDRVEVALGDFSRPESLIPAFAGVEAAFLVFTGAGDALAKNAVTAAQAAGSPRLVLLSSLGADMGVGELAISHSDRERLLLGAGLDITILRPGMFMSNTLSWVRTIRSEGVVYNPYGDGRVLPIAPEDIAAVAALALTTRDFSGQILELTGGEPITIPEQVAVLARVLDTPLRSIEIPVATAVENMRKTGMPPTTAESLGQMMTQVREGNLMTGRDTVSRVLGREPMGFEAWASRHAQIWQPV